MLLLRNPWGKFEWKGDWSFNSDSWTPQLRQQLGMTSPFTEGQFWMSYEDVKFYFSRVQISKVNDTFVFCS